MFNNINLRKLTNRAITGAQTVLEKARPAERHPFMIEVENIINGDNHTFAEKLQILEYLLKGTLEAELDNEKETPDA